MSSIKNWNPKVKMFATALVVLIAVVVVWMVFFTKSEAVKDYLEAYKAEIQVENKGGEKTTLNVRVGDAGTGLAGVKSSLIEDGYPLYLASAYPASSGHHVGEVKVPIDVAMFSGEGNLLKICDVPAKTETNCDTETEYQYVIMAEDGYFKDKKVSLENESKLLIETLQKM